MILPDKQIPDIRNKYNFISKKTGVQLSVLAYYQISGGIVGILMTIYILYQTPIITGAVALLFIVAFLLYAFSIFSGNKIINGQLQAGLKYSRINQAIQVISFSMFGYSFIFVSGLSLPLGIDLTEGFRMFLNLKLSNFQFIINSDDNTITIGINLFAAYLITLIDKVQTQIIKEKEAFEAADLIIDSPIPTGDN